MEVIAQTSPFETLSTPDVRASREAPQLKTWHVFALVTFANFAVMWYFNSAVVTRDFYANLMADRLDSSQIDQYFGYARKMALIGYLTSPLMLWVRIAFVALMTQFVMILFMKDVSFNKLFRCMSWAYLLPLYGAAVQVIWLGMMDAGAITAAHLQTPPGSAAMLFMDFSESQTALYALLAYINPFEIAWIVAATMGVRSAAKIGFTGAVLAVGTLWGAMTALKWGVVVLMSGLSG